MYTISQCLHALVGAAPGEMWDVIWMQTAGWCWFSLYNLVRYASARSIMRMSWKIKKVYNRLEHPAAISYEVFW